MSKKNRTQYGTFSAKPTWYSRHKFLAVASVSAAVLFLSLFAAYRLSKQEEAKQLSALFEVPEALASDMPGWWYRDHFGNSVCEKQDCKAEADPDSDKLTNDQEFYYHSDPLNRDTNGNGLTDGEDVALNYDPSKPGKVNFDEAASDESIFGESLAFNDDVKQILAEETSPDRIKLPEVNSVLLKISEDNSLDALQKYIEESGVVMRKHFPKDIDLFLAEAIETQDLLRIDDLKIRSARTYGDLLKLEVPPDAVDLHKYFLGIYQLLPSVITFPAPEIFDSEIDPTVNLWYDQSQAFLMLIQKINLEFSKLNQKVKSNVPASNP
jgi:hypothetical protein